MLEGAITSLKDNGKKKAKKRGENRDSPLKKNKQKA
jgi:hypothetical protein